MSAKIWVKKREIRVLYLVILLVLIIFFSSVWTFATGDLNETQEDNSNDLNETQDDDLNETIIEDVPPIEDNITIEDLNETNEEDINDTITNLGDGDITGIKLPDPINKSINGSLHDNRTSFNGTLINETEINITEINQIKINQTEINITEPENPCCCLKGVCLNTSYTNLVNSS